MCSLFPWHHGISYLFRNQQNWSYNQFPLICHNILFVYIHNERPKSIIHGPPITLFIQKRLQGESQKMCRVIVRLFTFWCPKTKHSENQFYSSQYTASLNELLANIPAISTFIGATFLFRFSFYQN
jgi:hypothetical protein